MNNAKRKVAKLVRPVLNRVKGLRHFMADDEVFDVFDHLLDNVGRLGEILKKPEVSTVRLVLNADRVAIAETRRAFTYFGLFGFPVDGIFANKVLPTELADGYMNRWFALQRQLLDSIDQSFLDVNKFRVPLLGKEPIGLEALAEMAHGIFGDQHPDEVLSATKSVSMDRVDGKHRLVFSLPDVSKKDLDVARKDGELILNAENYTRVFSLPDTLIDREIAGAEFTDGTLTILFE
jgi:arsenite-transporting ATPase